MRAVLQHILKFLKILDFSFLQTPKKLAKEAEEKEKAEKAAAAEKVFFCLLVFQFCSLREVGM